MESHENGDLGIAGHDGAPATSFPSLGSQAGDVEDTDATSKVVEEIESLCMNCQDNGVTRLLLTKIPFFHEIILMSFACEHCGFENVEVQAAGEIQEHGLEFSLRVTQPSDLQRQIVKSDTASCRIDDLDLEIPAGRGRLTSVEGLVRSVGEDLTKGQEERRQQQPDVTARLDEIIQSIARMVEGSSLPFTLSLNDPAGNSSIEPSPQDGSGKYRRTEYPRRPEQNASLGLQGDAASDTPTHTNGAAEASSTAEISTDDIDIVEGKSYTLPCDCPGCSKPASINMQMVSIPHFKQVVISAVSCDACGYRTNEVKTGGEIPARGKRIWVTVRGQQDLSRDLLKSETCFLKIESCSLEVQPGTMGGRFTTVEGLLTQVRNDLRSSIFDVDGGTAAAGGGDSMSSNQKEAWDRFFEQLDRAIRAEYEFEILLEDPLANSYVQSLTAPEPDPQLRKEDYERTAEEEQDLGLADMKTVQNEQGVYVRESA